MTNDSTGPQRPQDPDPRIPQPADHMESVEGDGPNLLPVPPEDLFQDLEKLRIGQDFDERASTRKLLVKVPVRKPSKEWWIRTHPDPSHAIDCFLLELKDSSDSFSGESYFVVPEVARALNGESTIRQTKLVTSINRQGVVFLWPIKLPLAGGNLDNWNQCALEIATGRAVDRWVRVTANRTLGAYDCFEAEAHVPEPEWPEEPFSELLRIAFQGRIIDSVQNDVVRTLRGQM